jgi:HAD superfamily hydrolase (TIGR01509 family)
MSDCFCSAVGPTRAVIFDVDGTLLTDTIHQDKHNFIISQVLRQPDLSISAEEWRGIRGLSDDGAYRYIAAKAAAQTFALETLLPEATYLAMARDYVNDHINDISVHPGVREVFSAVEQCGLVMGVATNADWPETERKLSRTGLAKYFHFFVCLDGVLAPKPAPDLYVRGIRLVRDIVGNNIEPEQVLAIEDTYVGALAAQRAGCRVIMCLQDGRNVLVDDTIHDHGSVLIANSIHDSIKYIRPTENHSHSYPLLSMHP